MQKLKYWGWGEVGTELSDAERAALFQRVRQAFGIDTAVVAPPAVEDIALRRPRLSPPPHLAGILTDDPWERLVHTYGKSYPDSVKAFARDFANAPDLVAFPSRESEVADILAWASSANVAVVPFGAGSSVVGGVEPRIDGRYAAAVSLDLRRMNALLDVDRKSRAARFQAGVLGPDLEAGLRPHGLTLRHFPQSFEFSTLGGWIVTRSGGHFATLYTHIDDLVESIRTVTPAGVIESRRLPGSGAGPSPDRFIMGSEGSLGVVTEAWIRVQDRPVHKAGAVVAYPDLFAAASAIRRIAQAGLYPSNLRAIDGAEARANGVADDGRAYAILAFESADHPVEAWMARALEIARAEQGEVLPALDIAERWRTAFIRMPYNRELLTPLNVINDTFETAITWDRFEAFHGAVIKAVSEAIREATGRDGIVSARFTHIYPDGPAPYYSFLGLGRPGALLAQWEHIKGRASDAVIEGGGTITHHHAIGRDHMPWYLRQRPELFGAALAAAKGVLDPRDIMNPGVLVPRP